MTKRSILSDRCNSRLLDCEERPGGFVEMDVKAIFSERSRPMSETCETDAVLASYQVGSQEFIRGLSLRDGFVSVQGAALVGMAEEIAALRASLADSQRMREELQDHYDRDTAKLKQEIVRLIEANNGVYWRWAGDGTDYLDSLTCPILIDVGQLHEILSVNMDAIARAEAVEKRAEGMEAGLQQLKADIHCPIDLYEQVGPTWTSRDTGHEYYDASYVLDKMAELEASVDALLAPAAEEVGGG